MIYVLKFFYSWVLPPACFVLALAWLGWRLWRRSQRLAGVAWAVALLLYVASVQPVSEQLLHYLEHQYPLSNVAGADVIIVLGGGTVRDVPTLPGWGGQLHDVSAQRLLASFALHRQTGLPILASGGEVFSGEGYEARYMRDVLITQGMVADKIIVEDRSLTTTENAQYSAQILRERGLHRPLLITSAFHIPRSVRNFELAGIEVRPYPVGFYSSRQYQGNLLSLIPSASALRGTSLALKEYLGLAALAVR